MSSSPNRDRFHGRVGNGTARCAYPGCREAGDFRAPDLYGRSASPNGPGDYQWLCLDHIREFNAGYDWFAGMSAEQIAAAQSPTYVWPNETRAFSATAGVDSPPKWSDFHDPLETISARFAGKMVDAAPRQRTDGKMLSPDDRRMLKTLGLGEDTDRKALRSRYSALVRKYHPDKNGGNRTYEKALQDVIAAYTHLKSASAFSQ
jgi:DnaJ domain